MAAADVLEAQRLVPGAPPLPVPDAERAADRINAALFWFAEPAERTGRRGRPPDHARRLLFHTLGDIFEAATEQPYFVSFDARASTSGGAALEWTIRLLSVTPLAAWAHERREGVAKWIGRARSHRIDLDAASTLATMGVALAAAQRPTRGRKKS